MGAVVAFDRRSRGTAENGCFRIFPGYSEVRGLCGEWIYLLGLPDGRVKVGRARVPRARIQTHWRTHGGLLWAHVPGFIRAVEDKRKSYTSFSAQAERAVLDRIEAAGFQRIGRTECFRGLDKARAIQLCREALAEFRRTATKEVA